MTHYACIAIGMADCMPDSQTYISARTGAELLDLVTEHCAQYDRELDSETRAHCYPFRVPADGESNYSQRLRIAIGEDWTLDVLGMTESEFERESAE